MGNYNRSNLKSFFICLMTILTILPLQAQDISKDLVLALTFDEGGGQAVADRSGQGNDAKIDGKTGWIDGKIGGGFQFDGKTWVIAPHIPFNERDFTVQFWVKSELISDQEVIFSQYEKNGKNLSLHLRLYNTGKVRLGYYGNDLDSENGLVEKNKWHNLTFWVDDSKKSRRIYVDGEKVAEGVSDGGYMGTKGERKVCIWNQNEPRAFRLILELKLFEYNEKEEAEKAARIYAKKLGIPYDGDVQESTLYNLVPQY